jgi:hypothetical protein
MDASATRRMSEYSQEPITLTHLERLSKMAARDNRFLTRDGSNWTDYRGRPLLVVLAQGAAQHYVAVQTGHGQAKGVKDLDVWSFFAGVPGHRLNCEKRHMHEDFGPSELGRQLYDMCKARNVAERRLWEKWERTFEGRRVDMFVRSFPDVALDAEFGKVLTAARSWLEHGILIGQRRRPGEKKPSGWHLAHKPAVVIDPAAHRGEVAWLPLL